MRRPNPTEARRPAAAPTEPNGGQKRRPNPTREKSRPNPTEAQASPRRTNPIALVFVTKPVQINGCRLRRSGLGADDTLAPTEPNGGQKRRPNPTEVKAPNEPNGRGWRSHKRPGRDRDSGTRPARVMDLLSLRDPDNKLSGPPVRPGAEPRPLAPTKLNEDRGSECAERIFMFVPDTRTHEMRACTQTPGRGFSEQSVMPLGGTHPDEKWASWVGLQRSLPYFHGNSTRARSSSRRPKPTDRP
jgi:hypothetical protein